jgi:NAD(P)H-hydrate repair Nnr-like enzyme with NAD(P)H-hydrate dehydratase domain
MDDRKNTESGLFNRFALVAVVAIAACATGAVILLAPAAATSGSSTASAATPAAATPATGYFPNQYVNQAKEIEPMPEMYY